MNSISGVRRTAYSVAAAILLPLLMLLPAPCVGFLAVRPAIAPSFLTSNPLSARPKASEDSDASDPRADAEGAAKRAALEGAMRQIERSHGRGSIMRMGDVPDHMKVDVISTGALTLDIALGGGLPKGRVVEIYGPESSGKTTLALHVIASSQINGGTCAFIDAEHALDPKYAGLLGVDVPNLLVSQPDSGEMALDVVDRLVRSGAVDVVVVDSVAALVPRAELEAEMADAQIGLQARLMSKAMRKITGSLSTSGCTVVFLNQLRSKVGVIYGSPEVTPGGNALKFYASVRLDIRRREILPDNIGIKCKVKIVKNKVAPPFEVVHFDILFGSGIDAMGCMLDAAQELEIVVRRGSWYSYRDANIAQGRLKACEYMRENPDVAAEVEAEVRRCLVPGGADTAVAVDPFALEEDEAITKSVEFDYGEVESEPSVYGAME